MTGNASTRLPLNRSSDFARRLTNSYSWARSPADGGLGPLIKIGGPESRVPGADSFIRNDWRNSKPPKRFIAVIKISYQDLHRTLLKVLLRFGFEKKKAELCARLFTDASRDGVYSHGVNRFPRFIETIRNGVVDIHAEPQLLSAHGAFEQWDGRRGPGSLNAHASMERAISLSRDHGIGCVALRHTNHWMRGGSYGWQAADAGVIGICWTNTMPNLPPWGASEPRLGNNPLVIAVPRGDGHIVVDMAMSQFSYGTLESYRMRGEQLPVPGGFDLKGELTRDPGAIEASARPLPIGYWKGSGLALLLDML